MQSVPSWIPVHLELLLERRGETKNLDYKAGFAWHALDARGKAEVCRDIVALANSGGGRILIGFTDGSWMEDYGIPEDHGFDVTKIGDTLRRWFEPVPEFQVHCYPATGKPVAVEIAVEEFDLEPHVCAKGSEGICQGEVYVRSVDARSKKIDKLEEMRALLRLAARKVRADAQDIVGSGASSVAGPRVEDRIEAFIQESNDRWLS